MNIKRDESNKQYDPSRHDCHDHFENNDTKTHTKIFKSI